MQASSLDADYAAANTRVRRLSGMPMDVQRRSRASLFRRPKLVLLLLGQRWNLLPWPIDSTFWILVA